MVMPAPQSPHDHSCAEPTTNSHSPHPQDHKRTFLFHWFAILDNITQKYTKHHLQFQHIQMCKDHKDAKTMDVMCSRWLSLGVATKEGTLGLLEWLGFSHFHYMQCGDHMFIVDTIPNYILNGVFFSP